MLRARTSEKASRTTFVSAINSISEKFDNKLKEMHDNIMREVERRLGEIRASSSSAASTVASEAGRHPNKRGRFEESGVSQAATAASGSRPNPNQVWLLGFPRELLKSNLEKFAKKLIETKMPSWAGRFTVKAYNLETKCAVIFEEAYGAHRLLDLCRDESPTLRTRTFVSGLAGRLMRGTGAGCSAGS